MGNDTIFVDTSMFYALANERNNFHHQAVQIWAKLKENNIVPITSNYVLDETFTLLRKRRGRVVVDEFRKNLAGEYPIKITRVTVTDEAKAWEWFLLDWSDLSFTDCISFTMMKRLDITCVATFDQHFQRAGFEIEKE